MTQNSENKSYYGILLVVTVVLFIGMAILYYLFLNEEKGVITQSSPVKEIPEFTAELKIAYINSDSVLANYRLAFKKAKELDAKGRRMEMDINAKQKQYEEDASYFQEQVNNNALSQESAQYIYEQLMVSQQEIIDLQEQYAGQLAQEEYKVNIMLVDSLTNFLERLNVSLSFDYILGYSKGGNVFLTNPKYDITGMVIEGLNKEYIARYGEE